MGTVDQIAIGFVTVAAALLIAWVLYFVYMLLLDSIGRAILTAVCALAFIVGTIGSVIWLIGRKLI